VEIVAVLDLRGGVVVRGIAGRRAEYRPVVSTLTASSDPLEVARAFRDHLGLGTLYVADLDAIAGVAPAHAVFSRLQADGFALWVDAGVREAGDAQELAAAGVGVVVGLETVSGPDALAGIAYSEPVLFSLDLKGGAPLAQPGWPEDPWEIACEAAGWGVERILILDLARVGTGTGIGTEELCSRIASEFPDVEVWAGGGIRGVEELHRLRDRGVARVLMASALHDGSVRREDLEALREPPLAQG
jgi:phosphoribosylformimino-5-aminoimidazole carboxamide ribotide isomerase